MVQQVRDMNGIASLDFYDIFHRYVYAFLVQDHLAVFQTLIPVVTTLVSASLYNL